MKAYVFTLTFGALTFATGLALGLTAQTDTPTCHCPPVCEDVVAIVADSWAETQTYLTRCQTEHRRLVGDAFAVPACRVALELEP